MYKCVVTTKQFRELEFLEPKRMLPFNVSILTNRNFSAPSGRVRVYSYIKVDIFRLHKYEQLEKRIYTSNSYTKTHNHLNISLVFKGRDTDLNNGDGGCCEGDGTDTSGSSTGEALYIFVHACATED